MFDFKRGLNKRLILNKKIIGFSLIELLVVMAIMAILMGLSAFGMQQARQSSRDGQRKSDLETIRTGLSFYKSDCNYYPTPASGGDFYTMMQTGDKFVGCGGATYLDKIPEDPVPGQSYFYTSNGTTYTICASMESEAVPTPTQCAAAVCGSGVYCNYYVSNP